MDDSNQIADVCLIEVGGTVGDIENMVFLEALRQFQFRAGRDNMMFFHLSLVPTLGNSDEQKVTRCTITNLYYASLTHKYSSFLIRPSLRSTESRS